ncbi:MAG: nucleoside deaminase [Butyricicoccus sp.]|nr:nucleoside deaminase [Butyricicoccus sp.]
MRQALELAREAAARGEVPVGCVIADARGEIIGRGRNRREEKRSALSHAETEAIEAACRARGDWRLDGCTLFVTLEPCPMCAGAIINSRVSTLVYGAREGQSGSCASVINLFAERYPSRPAIYAGVLAEESAALLGEFFRKMRG